MRDLFEYLKSAYNDGCEQGSKNIMNDVRKKFQSEKDAMDRSHQEQLATVGSSPAYAGNRNEALESTRRSHEAAKEAFNKRMEDEAKPKIDELKSKLEARYFEFYGGSLEAMEARVKEEESEQNGNANNLDITKIEAKNNSQEQEVNPSDKSDYKNDASGEKNVSSSNEEKGHEDQNPGDDLEP